MDNIKQIMSTQLTETEVMVYLLIQTGWSYRKIATLPFGISYESARTIYNSAEPKMRRLADAGVFSTPIKK